ncbi:ABC transporter substrate-binding protein [Halarcobacter sp.]|uniref:Tgt2/MlaC family protein n=1 Tax=Halarcobacter sp. TaxID=2321133 RepID=UPI0029F5CB98|nr:ABC transporter substrate-binding protein [Halarcobacter sp.]
MFIRIILSCFLIINLSFAMSKDEIKSEMSNKIDKVLIILKDSKLSNDKKTEEIVDIMDSLFDYKLMSRLSLGRTWSEINDKQKNDFVKLFTKKLKDSYVDKLNLYTDELVEILGTEQPKSNRIILKTQLIGKEDKYNIDYKFYEKETNNWLIYDVNLLGVSIIQTFRQQFAGFLKDKTFKDLMANLATLPNNTK